MKKTLGDIFSDNDKLIKAWNEACDNIIASLKKTDAEIKKLHKIDTCTEYGTVTVEKNGKQGLKKGAIIL